MRKILFARKSCIGNEIPLRVRDLRGRNAYTVVGTRFRNSINIVGTPRDNRRKSHSHRATGAASRRKGRFSTQGTIMSSSSPEHEKFQKIQEQHRELKSLLRAIETALAERTGAVEDVSQLLGQLGHQLTKHFQSEEAGGYFAEALTDAPQLIDRANQLMVQHPKMTKSAQKLAGTVDPNTDPDAWWQQTAERFHAFLAEFEKHEHDEDELIQEAFTRDIGAND